jgi:DNA-directed RNA polymerase subunit RPC12/RpoP
MTEHYSCGSCGKKGLIEYNSDKQLEDIPCPQCKRINLFHYCLIT